MNQLYWSSGKQSKVYSNQDSAQWRKTIFRTVGEIYDVFTPPCPNAVAVLFLKWQNLGSQFPLKPEEAE